MSSIPSLIHVSVTVQAEEATMSEDISSALRPSETFVLPGLMHASATAQVAEATGREVVLSTSRAQDTLWSRYTRHKGGVVGLIVLLCLILVACLARVLAPADPFSLVGLCCREPAAVT